MFILKLIIAVIGLRTLVLAPDGLLQTPAVIETIETAEAIEIIEIPTTTEAIETITLPIENNTIEESVPEKPQAIEELHLENIILKDENGCKHSYNSIDEMKKLIGEQDTISLKNLSLKNKSEFKNEINQLISLINNYRAEAGLLPLIENQTNITMACDRATESAYYNWNATGYCNGKKHHIRPNLTKASSILEEYNLSGKYGENYARFFTNIEDILKAWQQSPSHNSLLLSTEYNYIGVGLAKDKDGYFYSVMILT